jgi:porin
MGKASAGERAAKNEQPRADRPGAGALSWFEADPRGVGEPRSEPRGGATTQATRPSAWWQQEHFTGNWGGLRDELEDHGITLTLRYIGEMAVNTHGGLRTRRAVGYEGLANGLLSLDTTKLDLWRGGEFALLFQTKHGEGLSTRYVGDYQRYSNIEAHDFAQVSWYFYEQSLFDDRVTIKAGKLDANTDFAYVKNGRSFVNSSAGYPPNIPLPTYPDDALGVVLRLKPTPEFYGAAGVYDANGSGGQWGFNTAFHAPDDAFTIYEVGWLPRWRVAESELAGRYAVGGWYDSKTLTVFPTPRPGRQKNKKPRPPETHPGNAGVYVMIDQDVYRENPLDKSDGQGLGVYLQYSWASYEYNRIESQYGAGLLYTGLFPTRDEDQTGLMMSLVSFSPRVQRLEGRYSEAAVEFFHAWQITPFVAIQPDLQYIFTPDGSGRNALVFTLRFQIAF